MKDHLPKPFFRNKNKLLALQQDEEN